MPMNRRQFLKQSSLASIAGVGLATFQTSPALVAANAHRKLVFGVMGLSRGADLVRGLLAIPNVEIAYVCDIDDQRTARGIQLANSLQSRAPRGVKDVRRILEDKTVDGLAIAAPNHWHAPATILACAAGKHVYVEKPGSHNPREGELMVAAARKHQRKVQMGNQRRSWPGVIEMISRLHQGDIGRVLFARSYYSNARGSIGHGKPAPVPEHIDYDLWQGPAPDRPYLDNVVHYNWHWRWHWGGGELLNNGVHALDLLRWGLHVDYPTRVTYNGGRYHFDDDQETPDTGVAQFDFGHCGAMWDGSSCHPRTSENLPFVAFYGEAGCIENRGAGYRILDPKGKETANVPGTGGDRGHLENLADAIRDGTPLTAEIEDAQKSTLLCHLGNIAYRTGQTLHPDPKTGQVQNNRPARELWARHYRPGWEPRP
jgi:predicted dehydrogenase